METRLLDVNAAEKKTQLYHFDPVTEAITIQTKQDVTGVIDANQRAYNDAEGRMGDMTRVASIPMVLYYDLKKQGIIDDPVRFKRWLNDRDNVHFRTRPGIV